MTITTLGDVRSPSGHPLQDQETHKHAEPHQHRARAKSIVLAVAGIAGMISILWLIVSLVFGLSVIVFRTGSMAPTMPTGSMAITRPIPAADIKVGDVVTVPVPGKVLPVTHRVVSVTRDAANPAMRLLVLKGDDNLTADLKPYTVSEAKLVVFSSPGIGTALALARTPLFVGGTTVIVAGLLLWAFWPAGAPTQHEARRGRAKSATTNRSRGDR